MRIAGLEPAVSCMASRRFRRLSYIRVKSGRGDRIRTCIVLEGRSFGDCCIAGYATPLRESPVGLEPTTDRLKGGCSDRLSYEPA